MSQYISKTLKGKVKFLISKHKFLADKPTRLAFNFYGKEAKYYCSPEEARAVKEGLRILRKLADRKKIPAMESITRASRKVQEKNPELRGEGYEERKEKAEQVKQEILEWA